MTYQIYGLIDPRDNLIHYVGKTNDAQRRLIEHRNEHGRVNDEKTAWLGEIEATGQRVSMTILETVQEGDRVEDRELYWIKQGRADGWPLVNKAHGYETTERKLEEVVSQAIRLGVLPRQAQQIKQKRVILAMISEQAQRLLQASYDAIESARRLAEDLEKLIDKVREVANESHG